MTAPMLFPDFAARDVTAGPEPRADDDAARKAAFETGYQAGWDDCLAREDAQKSAVSESLSLALRDVEFTRQDLRMLIETGLQETLSVVLSALLPRIAQDALSQWVEEAAAAVSDAASSVEVRIAVAPGEAETIAALLPAGTFPNARVVPEPALFPGQAQISAKTEERAVDVSGLSDALLGVLRQEARSAPETREHG